MQLSKKDIFQLVQNHLNENVNIAYQKIEESISKKNKHPLKYQNLINKLRKLMTDFRAKWQCVSRNRKKSFEKSNEWLKVSVHFSLPMTNIQTPKQKG